LDNDGTSNVLDNEIDGEISTVPAPVTGYVTPLALAIQEHLGMEVIIRSVSL
jgi:hypothetical protein